MKKRIARIAVVLAAAAALMPLGSAAQADEPVACVGQPSVPASYWCLINFQAGAAPCPDCGPLPVVVDETCVISCFGPFDFENPGLEVHEGEMLVFYYNGHCYYVYGSGHYKKITATNPPNCP